MPGAAEFSTLRASLVCLRAFGGQDPALPGQTVAGSRADRGQFRWPQHRVVFSRRQHLQAVWPASGPRRRRGRRQLLCVPDGRGCAAGRAGDQPGSRAAAQGHHRESQLLHYHLDHAAVADSSPEPHQAADHLDLPGGLGRGSCGYGGAAGIDPRQPRGPAL